MKNWSDVFEKPKGLRLYVIHTGDVHMRGNIHFHPKSPNLKAKPVDSRFNPVLCFLVHHPKKGYMLLDTGIHPDFRKSRHGNFGRIVGGIIKIRTDPDQDVISQLGTMGLTAADIRYIVISHLHPDHTSGLPLFQDARRCVVYADGEELQASRSPLALFRGYLRKHLENMKTEALAYDGKLAPFEIVSDFFGDGSVFILKTPGHTAGHVSVLLNMMKGPLLLTFDAAHRAANLEAEIPTKGHYERGLEAVRRLREFTSRYPQCRVIYGHDPDQIDTLKLLPGYYE